MTSLKITSAGFAPSWLGRMFVDAVPFSFAMRIFDVYLHQGCEVHYRVALSILKALRESLLKCKTEVAFHTELSKMTKAIEHPVKVLDKAWKYKVKPVLSNYDKQSKKSSSGKPGNTGKGSKYPEVGSSPSGSPVPASTSSGETSELKMYYPTLNFKSRVLDAGDWNYIYNWMPVRYTIQDPILLHSMAEEGTSLQMIYKTLAQHEPTLVVVKSRQDRVRRGCLLPNAQREGVFEASRRVVRRDWRIATVRRTFVRIPCSSAVRFAGFSRLLRALLFACAQNWWPTCTMEGETQDTNVLTLFGPSDFRLLRLHEVALDYRLWSDWHP